MKKRQLNVVSKYEYSEKFHLPKSISKGVPKGLEQVETEKNKNKREIFSNTDEVVSGARCCTSLASRQLINE